LNNIVSSLPPIIAGYLQDQRLSWHVVWKPIKRAIDRNELYDKCENIMCFGYDPTTQLCTVGVIFGEIEQVALAPDDFIREVGKFTRGAPQ
jgi:hypothetical protein